MSWITTTVRFSGGYDRGPHIAVTRRHREPFDWLLQPCWSNGHGGHKYDPPLPGHSYKTRKEAEAAKRMLAHPTEER